MLTQTDSLQFIRNKILNDAQLKATAIISKAKEDYEKKLKEFEDNIKRKYEVLVENAKSEAKQIIERKIAETRVYVNRIILDKKEELIERAFSKAFEILKTIIKTDKYKKFLEDAVYSTAKYMGGGDLTVYVNDETVIENQTLDKIAQKVTRELGVKTTIRIGEKRIKALGGIIMKNKDGDIEVNNTIETLIEKAKNTIRSKVAKILFST